MCIGAIRVACAPDPYLCASPTRPPPPACPTVIQAPAKPHPAGKCLGGVRLPDGTLTGSTLTRSGPAQPGEDRFTDRGFRLSQFPADYLGITEHERLAPGAWADYVHGSIAHSH